MDYVKSGDQELGVVIKIKHREWVEETLIGYQIFELGWDLTIDLNS